MATTKTTGCFQPRKTKPLPGGPEAKFYQLYDNGGYADYRYNELDSAHPAWISRLNCLPDCCGYVRGRFNEIYCQLKGYIGTPNEHFYYSCRRDPSHFVDNGVSQIYHSTHGDQGQLAGLKFDTSKNKKPALGAIAFKSNHVAIIEQLISDTEFYVSESGWSWGTTNYFAYRTSSVSEWIGFIYQPIDNIIPTNVIAEATKVIAKGIDFYGGNISFDNITAFKTAMNSADKIKKVNELLKPYNISRQDFNNKINDLINSANINNKISEYFDTDISAIDTAGYRYTTDPPERIDYPVFYYDHASYGPLIALADKDEEKNEFAKFYPNIQLNFGTADDPEEITINQITKRSKNWTEDTIIRFNLGQAANAIKQILANNESISRVNSNSKGLIGEFQMPSDTIVGYTPTDLTYTGELVANVGDTITSVLDKIVEFLNNDYEYFYNTDGQFVFRKKLTNVHLDYEVDTEDKSVLVKNSTNYTPEVFPLEDSRLVISVNNNPDFANVKNDFSVWGTRDVNDTEIPIHYRCAIDKKPVYYKTLERLVPRYFTLDTEKEIIETLVRRFSEIITEREQDFENHLNKCLNAFTYQSQKVENAYLSLWGTYNENGAFVIDERFTDLINGSNLNVSRLNVDSHLKKQTTPNPSTGLNYFKFLFNYLYYDSIGKPAGVDEQQNYDVYENAFFVPRDVQTGIPLIFGVPLFRWEGDEPTFNADTNTYTLKYSDCPSLSFLPNEMRYTAEQKRVYQEIEQARIDEIWARNAAKLNRDLDYFKQDYKDIQDGITVSTADNTNLLVFYNCETLAELKSLEWWPQPEPIDNLRLSMLAKRLVLKPRPSAGTSATEEEVLKDAKKYNFFIYGKKEDDFDTNNESNLINGIMDFIQTQPSDTTLADRRDRLLSNLGVEYDENAYSASDATGGSGTYVLSGNGIIDKLNKLNIKKNSQNTLENFQMPGDPQKVLWLIATGQLKGQDIREVLRVMKSFETLKTGVDLSVITDEIFKYLNLIWMSVLPMLDNGVIDIFSKYFDIPTEAAKQEGEEGLPIIAELTGNPIQIKDTNYENLYKELQGLFEGYRNNIGKAFNKVQQLTQEIRDYIISQLTTILRDEVYKDIKAIKTAYAKDQYVHNGSLIYTTNEALVNEPNTYVVDWREIIWQMAEDYNKSNIDQVPNWLGDANFLWRIAKNNQDYYPTGRTGYEQYYIDIHDNFRDLYQEGYRWLYNGNTLTDKLVYYWKREGSEDVKFNPDIDDESARRLIDIPETLNFYFDFIDSENSAVSQFSVPAIGRRPKFVNDEKVKVINNEDVPQILFVPQNYITEDFSVGNSRLWSYKTKNSDDIAFIDEDSAGDVVSNSILIPITSDDLEQIKINYPDFRVVQVEDAWFVSTDIAETDEDDESKEKINGGFYPTGLNRSAKQVIESWLSQYTYCGENLNLTTLPIYNLKPNTEIYISDKDTCTSGLYLIKTVSIPLAYNGTMNISCTKQVRNIK